MRYLLKKRHQVRSLEQTDCYLDVYDAASGAPLYSVHLDDDRSAPGFFVNSDFALSEDEKFLEIITGEHLQRRPGS